VEGEQYNCPAENAPVTVHAVGQNNGHTFYDREIEFILGEGSEQQLPEGVDRAIRRINKGEKCRLVLKGSRFTYGSSPPEEFGLPANAELNFTLFLKDFQKVKASWEMNEEEKLQSALDMKEKGTKFLQQGKLSLALNKYNGIVLLLEFSKPENEELAAKYKAALLAGWLNMSLINLKMNETADCIKNCDKVLEKDLTNVKALYRKAQAYQQRKDFDEAIDIYNKVAELDPTNKAALQQILDCKEQIKEVTNSQRKLFKRMFS